MELKNRIPSLDGFRAIAIIMVIVSHLSITGSAPPLLQMFAHHIIDGKVGVQIFFVISGFLITLLLIREKQQTGRIDFRRFYIRRFLRIFPLFYFFLIVLLILNYAIPLQVPFPVILSSALFVYNFAPWGTNWYVSHSWSLGVEEQFYLLWPGIFLYATKFRMTLIWITFLLAATFVRSVHYKYPELSGYFLGPFMTSADFLFSGCLMAFIFHYDRERLTRFIDSVNAIWVHVAIFSIWGFYMIEYHPIYDKFTIPVSRTMINLCICFIIFYFIIKDKSIGYRFLNLPSITFIGTLSYSLYIWQQLFICTDGMWFQQFPQNIFFILLASLTTYYAVERPFLKIKKRF